MATARGSDRRRGTRTRPRDDREDPLAATLDEAQALILAHRRALQGIHDRIRQAHRSYLVRYHDAEAALRLLQQQLDRLVGADADAPTACWPLAALRLHEQVQALRQEQEWLAEHLIQFAAGARRVQAIERQAEISADFLRSDPIEGGDVEELTELARVHALQAQEDERRRLAREIHDGPAQALVNAVVELGHCRRLLNSDPRSAETHLERIEDDLRASLSDVRQFVHDLRPGPLADLGLVVALQQYLEDYARRAGLQASLEAGPEIERLPVAVELGIFRIVQEALQNVRKHARARRIVVQLACDGSALEVAIRDDGVGFDLEARRNESGHFGLASMAERAALLHATLEISSTPGAGTDLRLTVPLDDEVSNLE